MIHCNRTILAMLGPALAGALLLVSGAAASQDVLIRNAKVHTASPRGTLERADVLVTGGRIAAVGAGLAAGPGTTVIDAGGRPLTPGFFGGITGLGVEEVSQEPSTVDSSTSYGDGRSGAGFAPRPEFDVTPAFDPDSAVIGVNRVEGVTFAMIAPTSLPNGTLFAGQGAIARLDGRTDAFLPQSRTLFLDMGSTATAAAGLMAWAVFRRIGRATP